MASSSLESRSNAASEAEDAIDGAAVEGEEPLAARQRRHQAGEAPVGDHHAAARADFAIPLDLGHAFRPAGFAAGRQQGSQRRQHEAAASEAGEEMAARRVTHVQLAASASDKSLTSAV